MTAVLLAFAAGVTGTLLLSDLPAVWWPAVVGVALALAAAVCSAPVRRLLWAMLAAGFLGVAWSAWHGQSTVAALGPLIDPAEDVVVSGQIVSLPSGSGSVVSFDLEVTQAQAAAPVAPGARLRVNWRDPEVRPSAGEFWRLPLSVSAPRTRHNPGAFDVEGWRLRQRLDARARVNGQAERLSATAATPTVLRWRKALGQRVERAVGDLPRGGIIRALVIGDRGRMDAATWEVLTATGTNHLMAISGLHVGLVAGLVLVLWRVVWARFPAATTRVPMPRAGLIPALLAAALYAMLAGFSVPTQRALIMLTAGLLAARAGYLSAPWAVLAAALCAVLLFDPLAALSAGTWLSFGAVTWIILSLHGRTGQPGRVRSLAAIQWRLSLGLIPLTLLFFNHVAWASIPANLMAVPLFALVVVPLALLGTATSMFWGQGGEWLLRLAGWTVELFWPLLEGLTWLTSRWPVPSSPALWSLLVMGAGLVLILGPRGVPGRMVGILLVAALLWPRAPAVPALEVTLLDLAPGAAAIVQAGESVLVYDTGPPAWQDGGRALEAWLDRRGVTRLDLLVVSRHQRDLAGGWRRLVERGRDDARWFGGGAAARLPGGQPCLAGMRHVTADMQVRVLHPPRRWDYRGADAACVLLVEAGGRRLLLAGALGDRGQSRLLRLADQWTADGVLLYPVDGEAPLAGEMAAYGRLLAPPQAGAGALRYRVEANGARALPAGTTQRFWHR